MKEQDLVDLRFELRQETSESSGSSNDWHYYLLDIGDICFISNDSDDAKDKGWFVKLFNYDTFVINNKAELEQMIEIIRNYTNYGEK